MAVVDQQLIFYHRLWALALINRVGVGLSMLVNKQVSPPKII